MVTAADIQLDHDVEIVNGDHVIANLAELARIEHEAHVARGRGYESADSRQSDEDESRSIGRLQLDAYSVQPGSPYLTWWKTPVLSSVLTWTSWLLTWKPTVL